jgi:hypothetical protein
MLHSASHAEMQAHGARQYLALTLYPNNDKCKQIKRVKKIRCRFVLLVNIFCTVTVLYERQLQNNSRKRLLFQATRFRELSEAMI